MPSVSRHESSPEPTATIRSTPASLARATTTSAGSAHASRCACVSVTRSSCGGGQVHAREQGLRRLDALRVGRASIRDLLEGEIEWLPQRPEDPRRALGDVRRYRYRHGTQPVGKVVQDGRQLVRLGFVLCELPRRLLLDVTVEQADHLPDVLQAARQVVDVEARHELPAKAVERGSKPLVARSRRDPASRVAGDHRRRSRDEIAEVVRELALVTLVERVDRGAPVLSERNRSKRPEPHRVAAVDIDEIERVDHVAERLRDLPVVEEQIAVDEQLLRHFIPGREEQRRPVDAVEAQDVLAEEMVDVGPEPLAQILAFARVRERAEVVDERVYPDIRDLPFVPRDRHAPRLAGPADAEILEAALDEAARLVVAEARQNEIRPLVVELEQAVLIRREPEEVVLLLDVLGRDPVLGAQAVNEVGLALELLAADAVQAGVDVLVDVAVVVDALEELLDEALVSLVGRPNEEVVLRIDPARQLSPVFGDPVDVGLGVEALLLRDAVHLRRMLVRAGEEERLLSALAVVPNEHVRGNRRVRVPDMRRRVDVIDRCRQVEAHRRQ